MTHPNPFATKGEALGSDTRGNGDGCGCILIPVILVILVVGAIRLGGDNVRQYTKERQQARERSQ